MQTGIFQYTQPAGHQRQGIGFQINGTSVNKFEQTDMEY